MTPPRDPADHNPSDDSNADSAPADEHLDLDDSEREALHDLQLGVEYAHRAYGELLTFHHNLGHAMDRMADAEDALREAGHDDAANALRDSHLPAGALDERWTYELVEEFSDSFLDPLTAFEDDVRDELADGIGHVTERRQQRRVRERAAESVDDGGSPPPGQN
ncbi:hypothetical protein OB905_09240 [Halobacteria archaeon AArc-dxtr1]|nr:hypothetical protein [Halobacteria archaeon AArc-dxtr1]